MERIKFEDGYYYTEEFWHGQWFSIKALLIEGRYGKAYRSEVFAHHEGPYMSKSKCKRLEAKTPQIAIKLAKDQIRLKYKIPKEMQSWLDSDAKYKRRLDYEWKKNQRKSKK